MCRGKRTIHASDPYVDETFAFLETSLKGNCKNLTLTPTESRFFQFFALAALVNEKNIILLKMESADYQLCIPLVNELFGDPLFHTFRCQQGVESELDQLPPGRPAPF